MKGDILIILSMCRGGYRGLTQAVCMYVYSYLKSVVTRENMFFSIFAYGTLPSRYIKTIYLNGINFRED